jgi:hypothetical protein
MKNAQFVELASPRLRDGQNKGDEDARKTDVFRTLGSANSRLLGTAALAGRFFDFATIATENFLGCSDRIPPSLPCQLKFSIVIGKSRSVSRLAFFISSAIVSPVSAFPSIPRIFRAKFELNGTDLQAGRAD